MQTRFMKRTNSMSRGKRGVEADDDDGHRPDSKRPALSSVIIEALKVDSLQKLCSSLEPVLRRVVSEEVERALAKLAPARIDGRSSPRRIDGPDQTKLKLQFRSRLSLPLFTGGKIEGEQGAAIHIVLLDGNTGHIITCGPEACSKLDVVVLEGDFNNEHDDWTQEEFESHVVKEREGKRPLLTGDLQVSLKEGVGTLGELTFTDNSSWIRSRKFKLGVKVSSSGSCEGKHIREAVSEPFSVKDHRGELYKKHYPPALNDDIWRLEKIGKDGSFHRKLNSHGIFTVEDFLRLAVKDSQKLRNILGSGMSNKMWDALLEHAKTCVLSGKLYVYYPEDSRSIGAVFNNIYEFNGLISGGQYIPADILSEEQKVYVDVLMKKAYDNWNHVMEYDGKSFLNFKQPKKPPTPPSDLQINHLAHCGPPENQLHLPYLQPTQSSVLPNLHIEGYAEAVGCAMEPQTAHQALDGNALLPATLMQPSNSSPCSPTPPINDTMNLKIGLPQSFPQGCHPLPTSMQLSNFNPFDEWTTAAANTDRAMNEYFSEEIRMRSHELLENDDMQHLLRYFSLGGGSHSMSMTDDGFSQGCMSLPVPSYSDEQCRSGKAVVGWLKIKAAMRWGFFIRKKAAERRAQLVELED